MAALAGSARLAVRGRDCGLTPFCIASISSELYASWSRTAGGGFTRKQPHLLLAELTLEDRTVSAEADRASRFKPSDLA